MAHPVRSSERQQSSRYDPFNDLLRMQPELARFLEWATGGNERPIGSDQGFIPLADVEETDDGYESELELPGVKKGDIEIAVSGRRLTVSGERKEKERVGVLRRRERTVGRFQYEIVLPADVEEAGVTAKLEDGVLTVHVPKAIRDQPRRIAVK
jgi:HSP20 family protein